MRKLSLSLGLALFALAGSARAQDETPAAAPAAEPAAPAAESTAPAAAVAPGKKMQVGIAFLPMFLGRATTGESSDNNSSDLKVAYGVGVSFGYNVIAGLIVGVAPQVLFHVTGDQSPGSSKEWDLMARIAYAYTVIPKLAVYAEFLPGYSIISFPSSRTFMGENVTPKGLVLGFGAGAAYDITDLIFVNLAVGYQMGFQTFSVGGDGMDSETSFLRIALGGGVKF